MDTLETREAGSSHQLLVSSELVDWSHVNLPILIAGSDLNNQEDSYETKDCLKRQSFPSTKNEELYSE